MSTPPDHLRHRLNELIHSPVRFSIMAALARAESLEFKDLRDAIQVSDSVLSRQLSTLDLAGYVKTVKTFAGNVLRTLASLTADGRDA